MLSYNLQGVHDNECLEFAQWNRVKYIIVYHRVIIEFIMQLLGGAQQSYPTKYRYIM